MAVRPVTTGIKQARVRGRFAKGCSGNPDGKPKGARHTVTRAIENLLENEGEAIGRKCVELALAGDTTALRLLMDRIAPVRRARVRFDIPPIDSAADLPKGVSALLQAVGAGGLSPEEGTAISALLSLQARVLEVAELEQRIAALEQRQGDG